MNTLSPQGELDLEDSSQKSISSVQEGQLHISSPQNNPLKIQNSNPPLETRQYVVYHSIQNKTKELANAYAETGQMSHRYLAYRDLPAFIKQYTKGENALDYGTGTGISASFLYELGLKVIGVDVNSLMLEQAKERFPHLRFFQIQELDAEHQFDLIFSSFVLFDMQSKKEIVDYLTKGSSYIKKGGIFILITGSEELYSVSRKWTAFESNFEENRNLCSGRIAKLVLKQPHIEFLDYYWSESDYVDCFQKSGFKILNIHKPLGNEKDPYIWEDEKVFSPFTVYILTKE